MIKNVLAVIGGGVIVWLLIAWVVWAIQVISGITGGPAAWSGEQKYALESSYFWECRGKFVVPGVFGAPRVVVVGKEDDWMCEEQP